MIPSYISYAPSQWIDRLLIPRTFHRIWLGSQPMPAQFQAWGDEWRRLHPGWSMRLWTDQDVEGWHFPNRAHFDAAPNLAGKSDILRLAIMEQGGVYLDCDFEPRRNIEPLLWNAAAFVGWQNTSELNNAIFGAVPCHPFIAALNAGVADGMRDFDAVDQQTGPGLFTRILAQGFNDVRQFGPALFYPYAWSEPHRGDEDFPDAFAVHYWAQGGLETIYATPPAEPHVNEWALFEATQIKEEKRAKVGVAVSCGGDTTRLHWVLEGFARQIDAEPFELIVVNDGREQFHNEIKALVRAYSNRLNATYVFSGPPRDFFWLARSRNDAVRVLDRLTEVVIYVDSDCIPDENLIRSYQLSQNDGPCCAYGSRRYLPEDDVAAFCGVLDYQALLQKTYETPLDPLTHPHGPLRWWGANAAAPYEAIMRIGGLDEQYTGWGTEDIDLSFRLQRDGFAFKELQVVVTHLNHARLEVGPEYGEREKAVRDGNRPQIVNGGPLVCVGK